MARFLINRTTLIKLNPQNFILKRSRIVRRSIPSRSAAADGTGSYKGVCLSRGIAGGDYLHKDHNSFAALRPARRGGLCESKKRKNYWRPVILRGRLQSRQAAKPVRRGGKSNRAHHYFFASLRLCENKPKNPSRTPRRTGQALTPCQEPVPMHIGRELPQLRPARRGGSSREEKMCQEFVLFDPGSTF